MAEKVDSTSFQEKVLENGKLSLIDFYSDSCVPCKRMAPVLAELEEELTEEFGDQVFVGKVNVAWNSELAAEYHVLSAPTFLFLKDGKEVGRLGGVQPKPVLEMAVRECLQI
ncbi:MAG: thioredoxin family protein [Lachnospiraceae bacterium]|nr:thioredoxin family protein [Lachnospiraceae bacterium]